MPQIVHVSHRNYDDTGCLSTTVIRACTPGEALEHYIEKLGGSYSGGPGEAYAHEPFNDGWDVARKGYRISQTSGLDV